MRGASDAGIYVGQSKNIVVKRSKAEFNVAGIEIENSMNADVHDNLSTHNAGGILIFDLPNLPQQGGHSHRIFHNRSSTTIRTTSRPRATSSPRCPPAPASW